MGSTASAIFEAINRLISEGKSQSEIYSRIDTDFHYTNGYIDRVFLKEYQMTYRSYVKRSVLLRAFATWKKRKCPPLTTRTRINDICNFKKKFKRIFDFTPEEAIAADIDMSLYLPCNYITHPQGPYPYTGKNAYLGSDAAQILLYLLVTPVYVFSSDFISFTSFDSIPHSSRIPYIILRAEAKMETHQPGEAVLEFQPNGLDEQIECLDCYDIDTTYEFHGSCFFSIFISDYLYPEFVKKVDTVLPQITIAHDPIMLKGDTILCKLVEYVSNYQHGDECSVKAIGEYLGITEEQAMRILWKYAKNGTIRFSPVSFQ